MGKINVYDKSWLKPEKKKAWQSNKFYVNHHLNFGLGVEFTAWQHLVRASADII